MHQDGIVDHLRYGGDVLHGCVRILNRYVSVGCVYLTKIVVCILAP